jgi:hypothetical protein
MNFPQHGKVFYFCGQALHSGYVCYGELFKRSKTFILSIVDEHFAVTVSEGVRDTKSFLAVCVHPVHFILF